MATAADLAAVSDILGVATAWLQSVDIPQWRPADLAADILGSWLGQLRLVTEAGRPCGVYRLMDEDPDIWPQVPGERQQVLPTLALHRGHRARGLGLRLLDLAATDAAAPPWSDNFPKPSRGIEEQLFKIRSQNHLLR